jgi:hypothetical protein
MHILDGAEGTGSPLENRKRTLSCARWIADPVKMTRDEASGKDEQAIEALGGDPGASRKIRSSSRL